MTRTETPTGPEGRSTTTTRRARCSTTRDCRCGQQLDVSARAHCPRCGRSVARD